MQFYASDSSYSTQKQTRIMAPFASHTEAETSLHAGIFRSIRADSVKASRVVHATRNGAGESCQPRNLTRVNKLWFYFKVPRDAYFFLLFICFIFTFSLIDALGLITFAFIFYEIQSPLRQQTKKQLRKTKVLQNAEKKKLVLGFLHSVNHTGSPQDESYSHSYFIPGQNNKTSKRKL